MRKSLPLALPFLKDVVVKEKERVEQKRRVNTTPARLMGSGSVVAGSPCLLPHRTLKMTMTAVML